MEPAREEAIKKGVAGTLQSLAIKEHLRTAALTKFYKSPVLIRDHTPEGLPFSSRGYYKLPAPPARQKELYRYLKSKEEAPDPVFYDPAVTPDEDPNENLGDEESDASRVARLCVFPEMKRRLAPPRHFADDGAVVRIACLEQLYKIFERC